ncbi:MAG: PEP-CTERM sorting domain-containing protein [Burkholderiaceae bacterium]|nr:PEP-CTERM sorting domain-containing protein [Burkholderiaceae bacterium]
MSRYFLFAAIFLATVTNANANIFFQSATGPFDSWGCCGGSDISSTQFIGASFSINQTTEVEAIGGHFNNINGSPSFGLGGTIFGAIVNLGGNGLPTGNLTQLDGVLAYSVFTPNSGIDSQVSINATLLPGAYGLIFGSGLFGANGRIALTLVQPNQAVTSDGEIISINNSSFPNWGYMNDEPNRYRMFLSGSVVSAVPEPETYLILTVGLVMVGLFQRRRSCNSRNLSIA